MSRPSHVDSQRMISLLDEFNHRLEVLSCLTEENLIEISSRQEEFSKFLDPNLVKCLMAHLSLLRGFNNFNPENHGKVIDTEERVDNLKDEDYDVADLLEKHTIEVTRWIASDSYSFKYITESLTLGNSGVPAFLDAARDLRKLYITKLLTPVEEELSRERELEEIEAKLKKAKIEETENNEKLNNLRLQRDEGRTNRNNELQKLKLEREKNERETAEEIRKISKEVETKLNKMKRDFDKEDKEHEQTKEKLTETLNTLRAENKAKEEELIKAKQKQQSNKIEVTIKEYDKEMIENTTQHERETKAHNENKESLEMLEEHIRQLRMEKDRIEEESKREAIKAKDYESLQHQKEMASAYIAAHWKGLKARQDYEKLKKGRKRKGRKGK